MLEGRPFEGMTLEEADLAMRFEGEEARRVGEGRDALTRLYVGGGGARYAVRFAGSPPRVVDWVLRADDTLPGLEEHRPDFPR